MRSSRLSPLRLTAQPTLEPLAVTPCKACEKHDRGLFEERHCGTCHANDHYECVQCGACLPPKPQRQRWRPDGGRPGVRRDRLYCSDVCRQRAWIARHAPEAVAAQAAWDQEHGEMIEALREAFPRNREEVQRKRSRSAAEMCAECGEPITGTVWLRTDLLGRRLIATCERCRCWLMREANATITCRACDTTNRVPRAKIDAGLTPRCGKCKAPLAVEGRRHNTLCAECRPPGDSWNSETEWTCWLPRHTPEYCWECHPLGWHDEQPCVGCGRPVRRQYTAG
jgi:MYND finger